MEDPVVIEEQYVLDNFKVSPYPDFFGEDGIYRIRVIFLAI